MTASLIREMDFEKIKDLIGESYWENSDLKLPLGYWVPTGLLKISISRNFDISPLAEVPNIPIFYGDIQIDQLAYDERITCLCRCRDDGSSIKGVSLLQSYWYEDFCFEMKRCFRFHVSNDTERYWRVINRKTDVDWLLGYWDELSGFHSWISQLQL